MKFGENICIGPIGRSRISMTKQVLLGLDSTHADIVYLVEHDVLYHPSHFDFVPEDNYTLYFNQNLWRVRAGDGANFKERHHGAMSQLAGKKWCLRGRFMERLDYFVTGKPLLGLQGYDWYKIEPQGTSPDYKFEGWISPVANIDIRHGGNLTGGRKFSMKNSKSIPGWGDPRHRFKDFLNGNT